MKKLTGVVVEQEISEGSLTQKSWPCETKYSDVYCPRCPKNKKSHCEIGFWDKIQKKQALRAIGIIVLIPLFCIAFMHLVIWILSKVQ